MAPPIVLIGPVCAGKSTQANLLAAALHWPRASLDNLIWQYCAESGYSREEFDRVRASDGVAARRPLPGLFAAAVARIVAEHPDHVVDLGAGHTHLNEPMLRARLRDALAPCPNVVLLLPSPDVDRSIHLLKERSMRARGHDWVRNGQDHISQWVNSLRTKSLPR